jgi:hypothetical protein
VPTFGFQKLSFGFLVAFLSPHSSSSSYHSNYTLSPQHKHVHNTTPLPAARYTAQLNAKLRELHSLQAAYNLEEPISLRSHNRRRTAELYDGGGGSGGGGDGGSDDERKPDLPKPAIPRQPWHNFEKEKLRRSLLYFGIGRWERLRSSLKKNSRLKHQDEDVRAAVGRCSLNQVDP